MEPDFLKSLLTLLMSAYLNIKDVCFFRLNNRDKFDNLIMMVFN